MINPEECGRGYLYSKELQNLVNEWAERPLSLELITHFMPNRHAFAIVIHKKTGKVMHLLNTLSEDWEPDPEIPQYLIEEFNKLWDAHLNDPEP